MKKLLLFLLAAALAGCATYSAEDRIKVQTIQAMKALGYSQSVENLRADMGYYGR